MQTLPPSLDPAPGALDFVGSAVPHPEKREDRRYATPLVTITLADADYPAVNWSLGGFLLDGAPAGAVGAEIGGLLRIAGESARFPFAARILRRDEGPDLLACRFADPSLDLLTALHRAAARRRAGQG